MKSKGINAKLVFTGKKAYEYFKKRSDQYDIVKGFDFEKDLTLTDSAKVTNLLKEMFLER